MPQVLEALMIISFGISWPLSIIKSYKARTTKGKSLFFLILSTVGYICGITSKLVSGKITYVFVFYVINLCMLITELFLYARNARIDRENEAVTK
jgi:bacteriorhodopsin